MVMILQFLLKIRINTILEIQIPLKGVVLNLGLTAVGRSIPCNCSGERYAFDTMYAFMDLNMVRAGVVSHTSEWAYSGYNEIQCPRNRYTLIAYEGLKNLLAFQGMDELAEACRGLIQDALNNNRECSRDKRWTESVAVGSETYVTATKKKLLDRGIGHKIIGMDGRYELKESCAPYNGNLACQNTGLNLGNRYFWRENP